MPPLLANFIHARGCKPKCEKSLTLPLNCAIAFIYLLKLQESIGALVYGKNPHKKS